MTTRRGFLQAILACGVAPAVIGSGVLMPIRAIVRPTAYEFVKYSSVGKQYAEALARSMQRTKEMQAARVFNNHDWSVT